MGICCCLLDPQTNGYQAEVLIEYVWSAIGKLASALPVIVPESNRPF